MAELQSTNAVAHAKVREATFGVIPTNPAFKAMRVTSSGLNGNPQTVTSDEIRSDRQVTDLILVGQQAQGDVGSELSFQSADDDLEEAVQGTWANNPLIAVATAGVEISALSATTATVSAGGAAYTTGTLALLQGFPTAVNNKKARVSSSTATSVVFPASTFTAETATIPVGASIRAVGFQGAAGDIVAVAGGLTSTTLDFTTFGLVVGEWLKIGGGVSGEQFNTSQNNDWVRVSGIAAHALTFDVLPTGWAADGGTGRTISVFMGDVLRNGTTKRSNTIERQYLSHSPVTYEYLTGMTIDKLSLSMPSQKIATYSKTYMGKSSQVTQARPSGVSDVAAPTYQVLNTSANVGRIGLGGTTITGPSFVMEATVEISNNLRMQNAVGSLGAVGTGNGEFDVTGTLNTYFGDKSILDKVYANSETSFDVRLGRADGNKETLLVDLPRIKFSSGSPSVQGKNQDVMVDGKYQGLRHATLGYTLGIGRFWYSE